MFVRTWGCQSVELPSATLICDFTHTAAEILWTSRLLEFNLLELYMLMYLTGLFLMDVLIPNTWVCGSLVESVSCRQRCCSGITWLKRIAWLLQQTCWKAFMVCVCVGICVCVCVHIQYCWPYITSKCTAVFFPPTYACCLTRFSLSERRGVESQ